MLSRRGTLASSSALEGDIPTDRNNENGAETIVKFCLHKFCLCVMFIEQVYFKGGGLFGTSQLACLRFSLVKFCLHVVSTAWTQSLMPPRYM